jgi:subtilase family serine protease
LAGYTGATLSTIHPSAIGGTTCTDPGTNSDDGEAILDTEYASAAAPSAAIVVASCDNEGPTFGGLTAIQNLVNGTNPPAIISLSYGECEVYMGAAANAAFSNAYQQGVAEGMSIFVSAGDEDASECDAGEPTTTHGIGVNAFASTPYNVAVGGTDVSDTYSGVNSTYWSSTNNGVLGSALSYVPEIPWNFSCASQLVASYSGFSSTYGASSFCNSGPDPYYFQDVGGSGGPSGCATGVASTAGVVSGSCQGYAKPSWQSGVVGIPNDGVRDLPDVSLFAANGVWNHYYIYCWSDPNYTSDGSALCTGSPSGWAAAGGTSFSSPIMAGIQALINQHTGEKQGNPNYTYYKIAASEYGLSGSSACNSSLGNGVASYCILYDITLGDNDTACTGSHNCYDPSGTYGVLSTSNSTYAPAYNTGTGWDFATGLGSINAYNLVMGWSSAALTNFTLSASTVGNGTVTSSPAGISCGSTCSAGFTAGTQVTLTAAAASG